MTFLCTFGIQSGKHEWRLFEAPSGRKTMHRRETGKPHRRSRAEKNARKMCKVHSPTSKMQQIVVTNVHNFVTTLRFHVRTVLSLAHPYFLAPLQAVNIWERGPGPFGTALLQSSAIPFSFLVFRISLAGAFLLSPFFKRNRPRFAIYS